MISPSPEMEELAKQLKRIRLELGGISQREFHELSGIPLRTIGAAERREHARVNAAYRLLVDLLGYPEVRQRLKIMRGMDVEKTKCEQCKHIKTCSTKGGADCLCFESP